MRLLQMLCILWGVAEVCLTRRSGAGATSKDKGSLLVIWLVEIVSIVLGIRAANRFQNCFLHPWIIFNVSGICILVAGVVLRIYAILYLGRFFTINVAIASDHRVIDSGPYRYIRHPSYAGALMAIAGLGVGIGNWLSFVIIFVPIFLVLCWRMNIEEAALLEALGEPYRDYMKRTKRLIPAIY
jgi:protein-S-isoprenylcysteine O-methyltransferase Ste14